MTQMLSGYLRYGTFPIHDQCDVRTQPHGPRCFESSAGARRARKVRRQKVVYVYLCSLAPTTMEGILKRLPWRNDSGALFWELFWSEGDKEQ